MRPSLKLIASLIVMSTFSSVSIAGFQDIMPRDRISRDVPGGYSGLPVVHEFGILPGCPVPDRERPLLRYRVSDGTKARIARVTLSALEAASSRTIYESPARPGEVVITAANGIKDPGAGYSTLGYELVVSTAAGASVRRRIDSPYRRASVQLERSTMRIWSGRHRESRGHTTSFYEYEISAMVDGISSAKVDVVHYEEGRLTGRETERHSNDVPVSITPVTDSGSSSDRIVVPVFNPRSPEPQRVLLRFRFDKRLSFYEDYLVYRLMDCSGAEVTAGFSNRVDRDTRTSEHSDSRSSVDDRPSGPLPDLVPVLVYAGRQVQFRVENRGSAAVTMPFSVHVRDDVATGLDRYIEVWQRIDPGRSWLSEPLSTGRTIGSPAGTYIEASRVFVDVDVFRQVRESNEANNGTHWERPR